MDQENKSKSLKLGWTFEELASSLTVSVPFLRLEVKRGRLKAAHLGRRVVLLDCDVQRYLADASDRRHRKEFNEPLQARPDLLVQVFASRAS